MGTPGTLTTVGLLALGMRLWAAAPVGEAGSSGLTKAGNGGGRRQERKAREDGSLLPLGLYFRIKGF